MSVLSLLGYNRVRGFWELLSTFEFDFRRCEILYFLKDSIFGVFKVQSHTMWPYMCMCCGLFVPTQFHFECYGVLDDSRYHMYIFIFKRDLCKNMKPTRKVKDPFNRTSWKVSDVQIVRYTWVLSLCLCLFVSVSVSLSLCVACCVLLWWRREGRRRRGETNRTIYLAKSFFK